MTTQASGTIAAEPEVVPTRVRRQLPSFAIIGVFSGIAYIALFAVLRGAVSSYLANTLALAITAVGNTAANRYFTFGVRDATAAERMAHQVKGAVAFVIGLVVSNGSLSILHAAAHRPPHWIELGVLMVANLVATASRFLLMRMWVFVPRPAPERAA